MRKPNIPKSPLKRDGVIMIDGSGKTKKVSRRFFEVVLIINCILIIALMVSIKLYLTERDKVIELLTVIETQKIEIGAWVDKYNEEVKKVIEVEGKFKEVEDAFEQLKQEEGVN